MITVRKQIQITQIKKTTHTIFVFFVLIKKKFYALFCVLLIFLFSFFLSSVVLFGCVESLPLGFYVTHDETFTHWEVLLSSTQAVRYQSFGAQKDRVLHVTPLHHSSLFL